MRRIIPKKELKPDMEDGVGVFSFIVHPRKMEDYIGNLDSLYARKNLALRVFTGDPTPDMKDFVWGHNQGKDVNKMYECTQIQNLAAIHGLAPKVHDIVLIPFRDKDRYAHVVDFAEGEHATTDEERHEIQGKLSSVLSDYGAAPVTIDPNPKNIVGGKYTDFQLHRFNDPNMFENRIRQRANTITDWGSKTGVSYESVDELGVVGQRDTQHRREVFKMDEFDFKGKTVLDVGCSTGSFSRYAARRGAKRVVGLDIGDVPIVAQEISTYFGDFNVDFYRYRFQKDNRHDYESIQKLTGLDSFDVVFFLSVNAQVGYPTNYMKDLCKEACFVEGHSGDNESTYRPLMEKDFPKVEYMGQMKNNARPALIGYK